MNDAGGLLPGTLDLLILKAVSLGTLHGYGVLLRIQQISGGALQIQQGALYPALYRLEHQGLIDSEWGTSDNNRRAKFYRLTPAGRTQAGRGIRDVEPDRGRHVDGAQDDAQGDLRMRALWARVRSVWRALRRPDQVEAAMREEMRFHIDMEAERLERAQGIDSREAGRLAHVAFGGVEKYKADARDSRGLQWIDNLALDARLGIRMLVKYRGLTLVGGFAMAVAIGVGATAFEVITEVLDPALPFEQGDRVVSLQYATSNPGKPRAQGPARLRRLARGDQVGGAVGRIPQRPAQPRIGAAAPRADQGCGDHGLGLHRRAHAAACRPVPAAC